MQRRDYWLTGPGSEPIDWPHLDNENVYRDWCKVWHRDPEDTVSMMLFEEHCLMWVDENTREEWQSR